MKPIRTRFAPSPTGYLHIGGLRTALYTDVYKRQVFVFDYDKFVPAELLERICRYRVTSFCAPPTIYRFFVQEDLTKYDFSALEQAATAGEALNPEVFHKLSLIHI